MKFIVVRFCVILAAVSCIGAAMGQQKSSAPTEVKPASKTPNEIRQEDQAHRDYVLTRCSSDISRFLDVPYIEGGGDEHQVDIYVPSGPGPFPLVVLIHGGGWDNGDKAGAGVGMAGNLTPAGFVVASINYRFLREAPFPAQIEDCLTALTWLRTHAAQYKINPDRVGVIGHSAGGHLSALLATVLGTSAFNQDPAVSKPVQAAVVISGVTDLRKEAGWLHGASVLGMPYNDETALTSSPVHYVHAGLPPFLIIHGSEDTAVPVGQAYLFAEALTKVDVDVTMRVVASRGHDVMRYEGFEGVKKFFERTLKGESK